MQIEYVELSMQLRLYKESSRGRGRGSRRKKQMVSIRIYGNLVVVKVFRIIELLYIVHM